EDFVSSIRYVLSAGINFAGKIARLLRQVENLRSNAVGNRELQWGRIGGFGLLTKLPVRGVRSVAVAGDSDFVVAGIRTLKIQTESNRCAFVLRACQRAKQ